MRSFFFSSLLLLLNNLRSEFFSPFAIRNLIYSLEHFRGTNGRVSALNECRINAFVCISLTKTNLYAEDMIRYHLVYKSNRFLHWVKLTLLVTLTSYGRLFIKRPLHCRTLNSAALAVCFFTIVLQIIRSVLSHWTNVVDIIEFRINNATENIFTRPKCSHVRCEFFFCFSRTM